MLQEIIKGCRKQRRESQKQLYKEFYTYAMSIALRYSESRQEAVMILNDSFMKVFDNIKKYDKNKPFKPWLRQIVINTAINYFHKNKNIRKWSSIDLHSGKLSQKETIISGIAYDEIIEMVRELSPAYRTVFNLYVIEGFTHREIAKMLNISEGTSKSNLSKAKRNLRSILEKHLL